MKMKYSQLLWRAILSLIILSSTTRNSVIAQEDKGLDDEYYDEEYEEYDYEDEYLEGESDQAQGSGDNDYSYSYSYQVIKQTVIHKLLHVCMCSYVLAAHDERVDSAGISPLQNFGTLLVSFHVKKIPSRLQTSLSADYPISSVFFKQYSHTVVYSSHTL